MANLNDLPTELIRSTFLMCSSIPSAVALSTTCTRFHAIWLADKNEFLYNILARSMPAWQYAGLLALAEVRLTHSESEIDALPSRSATDLFVPLLLRNAQIGKVLWDWKYSHFIPDRQHSRLGTFQGFMECFYKLCRMFVEDSRVRFDTMRAAPSFARVNSTRMYQTEDLKAVVLGLRTVMQQQGAAVRGRFQEVPDWLNLTEIKHIRDVCGYFLREY